MAKKNSKPAAPAKPSRRGSDRDAATLSKIVDLSERVTRSSLAGREPKLEIPTRSRSNTIWNKKRGILEMGSATQDRELFNLNQAKQFMQTMLHASTIKDLIDAGKTSSLRGVLDRKSTRLNSSHSQIS